MPVHQYNDFDVVDDYAELLPPWKVKPDSEFWKVWLQIISTSASFRGHVKGCSQPQEIQDNRCVVI